METKKEQPQFNLAMLADLVNEQLVLSSLETKPELFRCGFGECNREFTSKRNLVDHCRSHHQGKRPHACSHPGCGKSFLRPAHLTIHMRIHTGEKPYECPFEGCGKRWNQKSALKQHMRSHTGEKPFICKFSGKVDVEAIIYGTGCNKRFSTSSSCKRHIQTHERSGSISKKRLMGRIPDEELHSEPLSPISTSSSDDEHLTFGSPLSTETAEQLLLKMSMPFLLN